MRLVQEACEGSGQAFQAGLPHALQELQGEIQSEEQEGKGKRTGEDTVNIQAQEMIIAVYKHRINRFSLEELAAY